MAYEGSNGVGVRLWLINCGGKRTGYIASSETIRTMRISDRSSG